jgi:hypothetical protein
MSVSDGTGVFADVLLWAATGFRAFALPIADPPAAFLSLLGPPVAMLMAAPPAAVVLPVTALRLAPDIAAAVCAIVMPDVIGGAAAVAEAKLEDAATDDARAGTDPDALPTLTGAEVDPAAGGGL